MSSEYGRGWFGSSKSTGEKGPRHLPRRKFFATKDGTQESALEAGFRKRSGDKPRKKKVAANS
jgi:hypothetical protein